LRLRNETGADKALQDQRLLEVWNVADFG
jgi:hypothetical protein